MGVAKKTLPALSHRPVDGRWDWRERYYDVGEQVVVRAGSVCGLDRNAEGVVTGFRINKFGRISYTVRLEPGGRVLDRVALEFLSPVVSDAVEE